MLNDTMRNFLTMSNTLLPEPSQKALRFYAQQVTRLGEFAIFAGQLTLEWSRNQALKYCRKYGHTFVTSIHRFDVCVVCHLDEELAVSINCLEQ